MIIKTPSIFPSTIVFILLTSARKTQNLWCCERIWQLRASPSLSPACLRLCEIPGIPVFLHKLLILTVFWEVEVQFPPDSWRWQTSPVIIPHALTHSYPQDWVYEVVFSFPEVIKFPIHLPARKSPSIPSGNLMMSANPLEFGGFFFNTIYAVTAGFW